jgi:hypothetical protein
MMILHKNFHTLFTPIFLHTLLTPTPLHTLLVLTFPQSHFVFIAYYKENFLKIDPQLSQS